MKKSLVALMMALVLMFSVTGCGSKEEPKDEGKEVVTEGTEEAKEETTEAEDGGLMVFAIGSDPAIINPLYADDRVSMTISHVIFDSLYDIDGDQIIYKLAESVEPSEDFLTYTLKLREGVKWHDGEDFTADDVIFTLESILDSNQNAKYRSGLLINDEPVAIEKKDDHTIEFKLPEVTIPFVSNLASISPIPKHIFDGAENIAESPANGEPVGTGPFKFKEHKSGELYQVERFDDYYGDVAKLDGLAYRVIGDPNSTLVALENGEISAAYLKSDDYEKFKDNENFQIITFSEGMVNNLFFRISNPEVSDVKVRQAIAYGIDKQKIIDGVYKGTEFADPASSSFSASTQFFTDEVEVFDYNPEKAKELLKEAGKEDLKIRLMYTSGNTNQEKESLLIQEMLAEVGIEVELLPTERATFIDRLLDAENQDFEIATNGYVMGSNPDGYMSLFKSDSSSNFSGYNNPRIDELFLAGRVEKDEAKREEIYHEIQEILAEEVAQYPTVYPKSIVIVNKEFKGMEEAKPAPIHMFDNLNKVYK